MLGDLSETDLPDEPLISAITLAELSVGPLVASGAEQGRRLAVLQQVEADFVPLPFDDECARAFGRVGVRARAYEALIAATALAHGLPLYTANPDDVRGIDGLEVRAVG